MAVEERAGAGAYRSKLSDVRLPGQMSESAILWDSLTIVAKRITRGQTKIAMFAQVICRTKIPAFGSLSSESRSLKYLSASGSGGRPCITSLERFGA